MTHKLARTSAAAFDDELMLRRGIYRPVVTDDTSDGLAIYGTAAQGATMKISVPGTDPDGITVEFAIEAADVDDDDSYEEIARSEPINATGEYLVGFSTQRTWVRLVTEVEEGSECSCIGKVKVGIVPLGI